jgi:Flp pilus assembly protein protease CpaA
MARTEQEIRDFNWLRRVLRSNLELPYGIAIAVGALGVYSGTWWMEGQI